jgi:drug/metabolite transporter (DMT)-like permease
VTRRGWLLLGVMGFIWGVPYLLIKVAVAEVSPPTLVLARTAIGAVVLVPFAARQGGLGVLSGHWRALLAFAALEIIGPWVLLSNAEVTLASSTTGLLVATVPVFAVVLGRLVGDRHPVAPVRWFGLVVGLAGVALLTGPGSSPGHMWPIVQVLLAALGYAIAPIIADRALQGVPPVTLTAACLTVAALAYLPVVALSGPHPMPGARALVSLAVLGVVCTALAFVLFFTLITEVGAARSTLVAYLNPLVAVTLGALVLAEPVTAALAAGGALIVGGSAAASSRPRRPTDAVIDIAPTAHGSGVGSSGADASPRHRTGEPATTAERAGTPSPG